MEITDIRHLITVPLPLDEVERRAILNALAYCNGNVAQAAKALGLGRNTLYSRMQRHGIPTENRMGKLRARLLGPRSEGLQR